LAHDGNALQTYQIPHALPSQTARQRTLPPAAISTIEKEVIICGDHKTTSSINGALTSGRVAAEAALASPSLGN
jgi:hypothetical protein